MPATLADLLEYLRGLGQRHTAIVTAAVALPEQFTAPNADAYPLVLVEPDPFVEQLSEGADLYRVAVWVLVRSERSDHTASPALVSQAKQLADQYLQQLLREGQAQPQSRASFTLHYGTADSGLSSGVRVEMGLVLPNAVNRAINPTLFTSL